MLKAHGQSVAERELLIYELIVIRHWLEEGGLGLAFAGNNLGRVWGTFSDLEESKHRNLPLNI